VGPLWMEIGEPYMKCKSKELAGRPQEKIMFIGFGRTEIMSTSQACLKSGYSLITLQIRARDGKALTQGKYAGWGVDYAPEEALWN